MEKNDPEETRMREVKITTTQPVGTSSSPRQPNERDESPDSQASPPRDDMKQAAADVASGQVNTDMYSQPARNPKNNTPATPSEKSTQTMPDGSEK